MVAVGDLEAILLDMDGTILDTTKELFDAVATAVNRMREETDNIPLLMHSLPELHHTEILTKYPNLVGAPLEEIHDEIIGPHLNSDNLSNIHHGPTTTTIFIQYFLQAVQEQDSPGPLFPDVMVALESLKQRYPFLQFGVATTKPTATAEADLSSSSNSLVSPGFRALLQHVQGTDPGIRPKPAPDVLLRCAQGLPGSVDISKTIYVGDTRRDAEAAKAAGCAACLTVRRPKEGDDDNALGSDGLIRSFGEIEATLLLLPNLKH